jgi:hypothetical protein
MGIIRIFCKKRNINGWQRKKEFFSDSHFCAFFTLKNRWQRAVSYHKRCLPGIKKRLASFYFARRYKSAFF